MATNNNQYTRGKSQQAEIVKKNKSRDVRLADLFDEFRKNVPLHPRNVLFGRLKPFRPDLSLCDWMIICPFNIKQTNMIEFWPILTKKLKLSNIKKANFMPIDVLLVKNVDLKKIMYSIGTYHSYMTTTMSGVNRKLQNKIKKWIIENPMNTNPPTWVTDASLFFNVGDPSQHLLKAQYVKLNKFAKQVFNNKKPTPKSQGGMSSDNWKYICQHMYERYLPKGYPNNSVFENPKDLSKLLFILDEFQDAGRAAEEQIKKEWEDYEIYNSSKGQYCDAYEATGTKQYDPTRVGKNRIYAREDKMGYINLLKIYRGMRPTKEDIKDAKKKELNNSYLLRPMPRAKLREDGTFRGFCNVGMGAQGCQSLLDEICRDFNVPRSTCYQLRSILSVSYIDEGFHPFDAARATKHKSFFALSKYQFERKEEEKKSGVVNDYMNIQINSASQTMDNKLNLPNFQSYNNGYSPNTANMNGCSSNFRYNPMNMYIPKRKSQNMNTNHNNRNHNNRNHNNTNNNNKNNAFL